MVLGSHGVREARCEEVVVCGSCGVWELRCGGVVVYDSYIVGELYWGGHIGYQTLIHRVFGVFGIFRIFRKKLIISKYSLRLLLLILQYPIKKIFDTRIFSSQNQPLPPPVLNADKNFLKQKLET